MLNEIGDSSNPFAYKLSVRKIRSVIGNRLSLKGTARFTAKGTAFKAVMIFYLDELMDSRQYATVVFSTGKEDNLKVTNLGLKTAFRVMSTVMIASKEYVQRIYTEFGVSLDGIKFTVSNQTKDNLPDENKATQRENFYLALIKKQYPASTIRTYPGEMTFVSIPSGWYSGLTRWQVGMKRGK